MSGQPSLRPASAIRYLPRTLELEAAEDALRFELVALVAGNRVNISADEVTVALREQVGLPVHEFSVHRHPE